ncbi:response regulator [Cryptosporangium aurantiacum]|uniref:Two component transcriptional regulator, LuxR family n=1 Tax=Cryptosporangium aurantiacum TaxID=134849 RepID=A0A1M7R8M3_9ACTN|nr:response regulator transcription factor [Cryptosporangium aurantiacum]SHN42449.1 two component transcriptional regulator, LuxR family [Cryptosporangium aurantiacum]
MIRVLIADDQDAVRFSFRTILGAAPDIRVVGEAADGNAALTLAKEQLPDVALVDIRMPGMDGLELTRVLGEAVPATRVVVVTTYDLDAYVHTALRNGACGFLLKHSGAGLLTEAVRAAAAGDALISPEVTVRLLRELATPSPAEHPLTDRELDIVALVAEGRTNAEIGATLYITAGTVKTHLANIQQKLGVENRVAIAAWAWDTGHCTPRRPTRP